MTHLGSARTRLTVLAIAASSMCSGGCSADNFALATLADVLTTLVVTAAGMVMNQAFAVFAF